MGPFLPSLIGAILSGILHRRRRCRACGRRQTVPYGRRRQYVKCLACGAPIPP